MVTQRKVKCLNIKRQSIVRGNNAFNFIYHGTFVNKIF